MTSLQKAIGLEPPRLPAVPEPGQAPTATTGLGLFNQMDSSYLIDISREFEGFPG